jgi:ribosomal protein S12 methylthiotransferase accessory factor YcaO
MKLASCIKLAHGRCETPEHTIARLEPLIAERHEYRFVEHKLADHLYWAAVFIDELGFRSMGKGTTAALAKAGAFAEGAEWVAAQDVSSLPGYCTGHQVDFNNALPYEELLGHISTVTRPF